MSWRPFVVWLPMIAIGIANGVLREATYGKHVSELRAHQLSTLTGIVLIGAYVWGIWRFLDLRSERQAILVGCLWLGLTVLFEFGFGRFVAGHSWGRLLHDYNLLEGRVWSLFLLFLALAPWLGHRLFASSQ